LFHVAVLAALLLSTLSIPAAGAPPVAAPAIDLSKVEDQVLTELAENGQTDFFIWMAEKADLSPAYSLQTKLEKGRFVFETLQATAERTQAPLRAHLDGLGIQHQAFYIANKIFVMGGTEELLMEIVARPDVAEITANHKFQLDEPFKKPESPQTEAIESNITFIRADEAWGLGVDGNGTVMAGNDTGLDWDHPALINQYRGARHPYHRHHGR
jgi:subtilisin family serine protease